MEQIIEWKDTYYSSSTRMVFTSEELQIPGLAMFAKHTMTNAVAPLPKHFHRDCFEFTFVTNGAISFTIENVEYELSGYDVFMTFPNEIHSTNLLPLSVGEIIWFQIDATFLEDLLFLNKEASEHLLHNLKNLQCNLAKGVSSKIISYIKKAFELCSEENNKYQTANYIAHVLYELMSQFHHSTTSASPDIEKVLTYINENMKAELSLDELAELAMLSTSQFKQKFKSQLGIAPRHYINYRKIQLSKKLLLEGIPITTIAMDLGFNTSSYFSVVFKRYNACSPSEYVKNKQLDIPDYFKIHSQTE